MDSIFQDFLKHQLAEGMKLAADSDVLTLLPGAGSPPQEYIARFDCPTLVQNGSSITEASGFDVMIRFPLDYLRTVPSPAFVVALLSPPNAYHPNASPPFLCIGNVAPGTSLNELIYQVYEVLTYQKVTPNEYDALNREACAWARNHMDLFPLTTRPLRRREISLDVTEIGPGAAP